MGQGSPAGASRRAAVLDRAVRLARSLSRPAVWGPLVAMVVLGLSAELRLRMVEEFPVWFDEGYYLNLAVDWIEDGELTFRLWRVPHDSHLIAGGGVGYGVLLAALWLAEFGVSLEAGRVLMLVCSLLALAVLFAGVRLWQGTTVATATVVFASVCGPYMALVFVRMDATAVLGFSIVLWMYALAQRRGRWWQHAAVGLLAVAAAELHAMAFVYVFALSCLYALDYVGEAVRERRVPVRRHPAGFFALGAAVASAGYLAVHVLPAPDEYFLMASRCVICGPRGLRQEWTRVVGFCADHPIDAVIIALAVGALFGLVLRRRRPEDRRALALAGGIALGLAVVNPPAKTIYLNQLVPPMALVVGSAWGGLFEVTRRWRPVLVAVALVAVLALYDRALFLNSATDPRWDLPEDCPQLAAIREHAPPDTVVMAVPPYFVKLTEYTEFLADDPHARLVAEALYGVPYSEFLELQSPKVYLELLWPPPGSEAGARDGPSWEALDHMTRHGFVEVLPRLWVSPELLEDDACSSWAAFAPSSHIFAAGFECGGVDAWRGAEAGTAHRGGPR